MVSIHGQLHFGNMTLTYLGKNDLVFKHSCVLWLAEEESCRYSCYDTCDSDDDDFTLKVC